MRTSEHRPPRQKAYAQAARTRVTVYGSDVRLAGAAAPVRVEERCQPSDMKLTTNADHNGIRQSRSETD
jgi:hypothetical protein